MKISNTKSGVTPAKKTVRWSELTSIDPSKSGVLTPGPRFTAGPHGWLTDARSDTQRSGHGGLNGPVRLEPKYSASPSSETVGVMSKNGPETGGGTRSGTPQALLTDLRLVT